MLGKKGFTLIELMVVIIIVGILAAVAVPTMRMNVRRAQGTEGIAILGTIRTAQRIYFAEHGVYASNTSGGGETSVVMALLNLTAADLGGQYYGGDDLFSRLDFSAGASGDVDTSFYVGINGTGDASGQWIEMNDVGEIRESYANDSSFWSQ